MSFGLIWPYFVGGHAKALYGPEGHAACFGGGCGAILFLFLRGHKRTEETLVALKQSQINNLSPNDSQVWAGRTAICGRANGGIPPQQWWHGLQQEHDYVIISAVGRAQTKPQREGRC